MPYREPAKPHKAKSVPTWVMPPWRVVKLLLFPLVAVFWSLLGGWLCLIYSWIMRGDCWSLWPFSCPSYSSDENYFYPIALFWRWGEPKKEDER